MYWLSIVNSRNLVCKALEINLLPRSNFVVRWPVPSLKVNIMSFFKILLNITVLNLVFIIPKTFEYLQ